MSSEISMGISLVISILSGLLSSFIFYVLKKQDAADKDLSDRINDNRKQLDEKLEKILRTMQCPVNGAKILEIESKLWGEEKLSRVVETAVSRAMTEWKLQLYEEGFIMPSSPMKKERKD